MWQQYKKTFGAMQITIGLVTVAVLGLTRSGTIPATFFVMMQGGAIVGAMWGARLRRPFEGSRAGRLPARRA